MPALTLTAFGASTGVVIPEDMLTRLNIGRDDVLYAVETPDGGYRLTTNDPDVAHADRLVQKGPILVKPAAFAAISQSQADAALLEVRDGSRDY